MVAMDVLLILRCALSKVSHTVMGDIGRKISVSKYSVYVRIIMERHSLFDMLFARPGLRSKEMDIRVPGGGWRTLFDEHPHGADGADGTLCGVDSRLLFLFSLLFFASLLFGRLATGIKEFDGGPKADGEARRSPHSMESVELVIRSWYGVCVITAAKLSIFQNVRYECQSERAIPAFCL